jgi:hypothetical protein
MLRVLAAMLDWRGIRRPLKRGCAYWLTVNDDRAISTSKLRAFLQHHLPEFLTAESPVLANPVSQTEAVSKSRLANTVSKLEPLTGQTPDSAGPNLNGWTIRKDKHGYYRAYRKIRGKTKSVYLGKTLDRVEEKTRRNDPRETP